MQCLTALRPSEGQNVGKPKAFEPVKAKTDKNVHPTKGQKRHAASIEPSFLPAEPRPQDRKDDDQRHQEQEQLWP
jgi:hypothetical protein